MKRKRIAHIIRSNTSKYRYIVDVASNIMNAMEMKVNKIKLK